MVCGGAMTATTRGGCDDESEEMSRLGVERVRNPKNIHAKFF